MNVNVRYIYENTKNTIKTKQNIKKSNKNAANNENIVSSSKRVVMCCPFYSDKSRLSVDTTAARSISAHINWIQYFIFLH